MSPLIPVRHKKNCLSFFLPFFPQSWWVWADTEITDLWYNCFYDNATKTWLCAATTESGKFPKYLLACINAHAWTFNFACESVSYTLTLTLWPALPDWLQSVQALMVLSVVFSSISFLVFLGQLFTMSKGGLFYFTGLCQAFAGVWRFIQYVI